MKFSGYLMVLGGAIAFWALFIFDTSVATGIGRVNNLGLMADRQNFMIFGSMIFIAGLLIGLFGNKNKKNEEKSEAMKEAGVDVHSEFWQDVRSTQLIAYQIYLVKKYSIEKNVVLEKVIFSNTAYDSIEEAIEAAHLIDTKQELEWIEKVTSPQYEKRKGKIGHGTYDYVEYGDGKVVAKTSTGIIKEFSSFSDAKTYFGE